MPTRSPSSGIGSRRAAQGVTSPPPRPGRRPPARARPPVEEVQRPEGLHAVDALRWVGSSCPGHSCVRSATRRHAAVRQQQRRAGRTYAHSCWAAPRRHVRSPRSAQLDLREPLPGRVAQPPVACSGRRSAVRSSSAADRDHAPVQQWRVLHVVARGLQIVQSRVTRSTSARPDRIVGRPWRAPRLTPASRRCLAAGQEHVPGNRKVGQPSSSSVAPPSVPRSTPWPAWICVPSRAAHGAAVARRSPWSSSSTESWRARPGSTGAGVGPHEQPRMERPGGTRSRPSRRSPAATGPAALAALGSTRAGVWSSGCDNTTLARSRRRRSR